MRSLKQILKYCLWTILAVLMGMLYMKLLLGPNNVSKEGVGFLAHIFYSWGIVYVGLIIGLVIAVLFVLLDVFYLKNKLKNKKKSVLIRFSILLVITVFVIILHFLLEKVIDVI